MILGLGLRVKVPILRPRSGRAFWRKRREVGTLSCGGWWWRDESRIFQLRLCFAFAKHNLRSGRQGISGILIGKSRNWASLRRETFS